MNVIRTGFFLLIAASWCPAGQLGINIGLPERGGTFVDIVKENYRWTKASTGADLTAGDVDSNGWPKTDANFVLDLRPVAEWAGTVDDPASYHLDLRGTYKCCLTGRATVSSAGQGTVQNALYDSATNVSTFDFVITDAPAPGGGFIELGFTNTKRTLASATGSGFTNFRMLYPGYPLNTSATFTSAFLGALSGINFSAIRFMVFTGTNGMDPAYPGTTAWARRKHIADAGQPPIAPIGKTDGGAWEYVIQIANAVHKDAWINVPISADAGYVRNLAQLFKDSLKSDLNLYVESSNEVWNTAPGFGQSSYNQAWAKALGITEHQNHARRTVSLAMTFDSVFGAGGLNNRVRVVLCSHKPMLKWWVVPMLQYVDSAFGAPSKFIYAIGCQTYFSGTPDSTAGPAQILSAGHDDIKSQIDETGGVNDAGRKQWIAAAKSWNLAGGYVSYEGGPDHGGGSTVNVANRILAERDIEMGELMKYNYDTAFLALGGTLAMQFSLSSSYSRYGCWGLTDDIAFPNRNYKYAAMKSIVGGPAAVKVSPARPAQPTLTVCELSRHRIAVRFLSAGDKVPTATLLTVSGRAAPPLLRSPIVPGGAAEWISKPLSAGTYLLKVESGDSRLVKRVVMGR